MVDMYKYFIQINVVNTLIRQNIKSSSISKFSPLNDV